MTKKKKNSERSDARKHLDNWRTALNGPEPASRAYSYSAVLALPVPPCQGAVGEFIYCPAELTVQDVTTTLENEIVSQVLNINYDVKGD